MKKLMKTCLPMALAVTFLVPNIALADEDLSKTTTKTFCDAARAVSDEISDQLPLKVDAATTLLGQSAVFYDGSCHVSYQFAFDDIKMTRMYIDQLGMSIEDIEFLFGTEEGLASFAAVVEEDMTDAIELEMIKEMGGEADDAILHEMRRLLKVKFTYEAIMKNEIYDDISFEFEY